MEIETASKELIETNSILVKKIKDIRNVSDIAFHATTRIDIADSMEYITSKMKEILGIEKFGIFTYNKEEGVLYSVRGSFGMENILKIVNKKGTIYNDIINSGNRVVVNKDSDLKDYSRNLINDSVKLKSAVFLPVKQGNDVIAIIVAINKKDSNFNCTDVKALEHISVIIYGIIERMNLYKKIKS